MRSSQHIYNFSLQIQIPNIKSGFQQSRTIGLIVVDGSHYRRTTVRTGRLLNKSTTGTGAVVYPKQRIVYRYKMEG
jgi:hypothetical protein